MKCGGVFEIDIKCVYDDKTIRFILNPDDTYHYYMPIPDRSPDRSTDWSSDWSSSTDWSNDWSSTDWSSDGSGD